LVGWLECWLDDCLNVALVCWLVLCRLTVVAGLTAVKPCCPGSLPELEVWLTISPRLENVQLPGNIETIEIPAANQNKRTDVD
jgi:hypothetical protein